MYKVILDCMTVYAILSIKLLNTLFLFKQNTFSGSIYSVEL